jgi:serine/threonine protein kinase
VSLLGAGGMGEVYRARDPRLKREVALKVLPDVAAVDADRRERFTREALAVAALNHPHIVTIHSVEDAGTAIFLTMELVEGRSLAEALPPTGLPIERVLTIGIAVADATSAAHQKGITHRDLKPGNIMLGEGEQAGRIKVLDFGLAKVIDVQRGAGRRIDAADRGAGTQRADHRRRTHPGHRGLHVPRAGGGPGDRWPVRSVFAGSSALRDGHRAATVRR